MSATYLGERQDIPARGPSGSGWDVPADVMRAGGGARWIEEQWDSQQAITREAMARQQRSQQLAMEASELASLRREVERLRADLDQQASAVVTDELAERLAALEERLITVEDRKPDSIGLEAGAAALALAGHLEDARRDVREAREDFALERIGISQELAATQTLMGEARNEASGWFAGLQERFQAAVSELKSWAEEEVRAILRAVPVPVGLASIVQPADDRLVFELTDGSSFTARLARGPRGYRGDRGLAGAASVAVLGGGGGGLASLMAAPGQPITTNGPAVAVNVGQVGDSSVFLVEISTPTGERALYTIWAALADVTSRSGWTVGPEITSDQFPSGVSTSFAFSKGGIGGADTVVSVTATGSALPAGSEVKVVAVATVK